MVCTLAPHVQIPDFKAIFPEDESFQRMRRCHDIQLGRLVDSIAKRLTSTDNTNTNHRFLSVTPLSTQLQ